MRSKRSYGVKRAFFVADRVRADRVRADRASHAVRQCLTVLALASSSMLLLVLTVWAGPAAADDSERCLSAYENAQVLRLRGRYLEARDALLVCSDRCPALLSKDCVTWLPEVEASLSSVVFAVTDTQGNDLVQARVSADGRLLTSDSNANGRAVALDPGVYKLRFEAPGFAPQEQTLTVRESEKNRIVRVQLSSAGDEESVDDDDDSDSTASTSDTPGSAREPRHVPLASYVLGGTAVAGAAAFTYFAVAGKREYDRLDASCSPGCSASQTKAGRRDYVLADVALGVSLAATAAALWVYFAKRDAPTRATAGVTLSVGRQSAHVGWETPF